MGNPEQRQQGGVNKRYGMGMHNRKPDTTRVSIPPRPFLYTLDQVEQLTSIPMKRLQREFIYFEGRSAGKNPKNRMVARNVAGPEDTPTWRIAEKELIRWMEHKGFRYYERGWLEH